jgi:hypothetical protein
MTKQELLEKLKQAHANRENAALQPSQRTAVLARPAFKKTVS